MDIPDKKSLLEKHIEDQFIVPALKSSGWLDRQISRQESYTAGRIIVRRGSENLWNRGERKRPDFILYHVSHIPLAIIEAKDNSHAMDSGMGQALGYADVDNGGLDVLFVYATNGDGFIELDKTTGEQKILTLEQFPTPADLWQRYLAAKGLSHEKGALLETPYYDGATPRYYQFIAVNRVFEAVLRGEKRMLLVMATGTGKTFMAAQIIYRLREAKQARRFLFLVDRNTLADQTMRDDFKIFSRVMTKVQNRTIEKEYEVYLALYQAVTGTEELSNIYKQFSPDFFDVVIVDECHRGSADEDAAWREVLEYFKPAVQVGLTATPKETRKTSNSEYFGGEPIYTYSLFRGIDDGFLAPFKVIEKIVDKDRAGYVPEEGKSDKLTGDLIPARIYNTLDFDRNLIIEERTQLVAKHVSDFLKSTDRKQKTIIFCRDIDHAERMKIALIAENIDLYEENSKYIMQITSGEKGEAGRAQLENFQSKEPKYPIIVTTSKLLTTGVNAPTVKLIVLDTFINSRTEFKQIIGRGTRIAEKFGKVFFTIMDFRGSTQQFYDPDFDGNPIIVNEMDETGQPAALVERPKPNDEGTGPKKFVIDGVQVEVIMETVRYYDGEGRVMHENLTDYTRKNILENFASLDKFLARWNNADNKEILLNELRSHGILTEALKDEVGEQYKHLDDFDLILHLAFGAKPLTREERARNVQKRDVYSRHGGNARQVLDALLQKYADEGVAAIEDTQDLKVRPFTEIGTPVEIVKLFGGKDGYFAMLTELKNELYKISA